MRTMIAILCAFSLVPFATAATRSMQLPPHSIYADTETSTNIPFSFVPEGPSAFEVIISLEASSSNNLEVAFGCDANNDGGLAIEEQSLCIGWDCGAWFLRNDKTGDCLSAMRPCGAHSLVVSIPLNFEKRHPTGLIAKDGDIVFSHANKSGSKGLFDPSWNMARITARGSRGELERIVVGFISVGLSVHLR